MRWYTPDPTPHKSSSPSSTTVQHPLLRTLTLGPCIRQSIRLLYGRLFNQFTRMTKLIAIQESSSTCARRTRPFTGTEDASPAVQMKTSLKMPTRYEADCKSLGGTDAYKGHNADGPGIFAYGPFCSSSLSFPSIATDTSSIPQRKRRIRLLCLQETWIPR